jgi:hypothetical protein
MAFLGVTVLTTGIGGGGTILVIGFANLTITTGWGSIGFTSGTTMLSTAVYINPKTKPKWTNNTKLAGTNLGVLSGAKGRLLKNDITNYLLILEEVKTISFHSILNF